MAGTDIRMTLARWIERLNARPLGVVVFAASVVLLVQLQSTQFGRFRARAVADARPVEHPVLVTSFVERLHARPGDLVEPGTPLVELSPHFIERELAQVIGEIENTRHEASLALAALLVEEERWLDSELRRRPSRPSLRSQTEAVFARRLELLETRRTQLAHDRDQLLIRSGAAGRVASVLAVGSPVAVGASVGSVVPRHAREIVAYVPASTDAALIEPGTPARVTESHMAACRGSGSVERLGAGVVQAPGQLEGFLQRPVHGLPVYISIPSGCELGVGQVISIEFAKAGG